MPRGNLETTLYSAEIPWLDAFSWGRVTSGHSERLLCAAAKRCSHGAEPVASEAFCWNTIFRKYSQLAAPLQCNGGGGHLGARSAVVPALHGALGHCSPQSLCQTARTRALLAMHRCSLPSEAFPSGQKSPLCSQQSNFTGLVYLYFIYK